MYVTGYVSWPDLEEAEGFGLNGCGAREDIGGHGSRGGGLNAVSGEGGEVGEQCHGEAVGSAFPGGFGASALRICHST